MGSVYFLGEIDLQFFQPRMKNFEDLLKCVLSNPKKLLKNEIAAIYVCIEDEEIFFFF